MFLLETCQLSFIVSIVSPILGQTVRLQFLSFAKKNVSYFMSFGQTLSQIIRFTYQNTINGGNSTQFMKVDYNNVGYGDVFHAAAMVSRRINYVPYELPNIVSKDTNPPTSLCFKHILVCVKIMHLCFTMLFVQFADFVLFFRLKQLMVHLIVISIIPQGFR